MVHNHVFSYLFPLIELLEHLTKNLPEKRLHLGRAAFPVLWLAQRTKQLFSVPSVSWWRWCWPKSNLHKVTCKFNCIQLQLLGLWLWYVESNVIKSKTKMHMSVPWANCVKMESSGTVQPAQQPECRSGSQPRSTHGSSWFVLVCPGLCWVQLTLLGLVRGCCPLQPAELQSLGRWHWQDQGTSVPTAACF